MGIYNNYPNYESPYSASYPIEFFVCYTPNCNSTVINGADIALVRTPYAFTFNEGVGFACLPFKYQGFDFTGYQVEISGWDAGKTQPMIQQKKSLIIMSNDTCKNELQKSITSNQICTSAVGVNASCKEDLGKGLLFTGIYRGHINLIGIVAPGGNCDNKPSVNTWLNSHLLKWIEDNTYPTFKFCKV